MISSTAFSMAPVSVTCFMPRLSTICARIAAFGPDDLEQVLGDLAGDHALADQLDDARRVGRRDTGDVRDVLPSLLRRPNSSLMTQLAAALPSRPLATALEEIGRGALRRPARRRHRPTAHSRR